MLGVCDPRPCLVNGRTRAVFHGWAEMERPLRKDELGFGSPAGNLKCVNALVEYLGGDVEAVSPKKIRFLDSKSLFSEFDWEDGDKE